MTAVVKAGASRQVAAAVAAALLRTASSGAESEDMEARCEANAAALNVHGDLNTITGSDAHSLGMATKHAWMSLSPVERKAVTSVRRKANAARHQWRAKDGDDKAKDKDRDDVQQKVLNQGDVENVRFQTDRDVQRKEQNQGVVKSVLVQTDSDVQQKVMLQDDVENVLYQTDGDAQQKVLNQGVVRNVLVQHDSDFLQEAQNQGDVGTPVVQIVQAHGASVQTPIVKSFPRTQDIRKCQVPMESTSFQSDAYTAVIQKQAVDTPKYSLTSYTEEDKTSLEEKLRAGTITDEQQHRLTLMYLSQR